MAHVTANGARLYYEQHGSGVPILCIHGTGSAGFAWTAAAERLARYGRVIVYDRRGFTRSALAEPPPTTPVAVHTDDARALLATLDAMPAVVIGRSYGGGVALDLALGYPEAVQALVLLEAFPAGLSTEADTWGQALGDALERAAAERGPEAVEEAMLRGVAGAWESLPSGLRELFAANGAAILAETRGGDLVVDPAGLAAIQVPTMLMSAADSPAVFQEATDALVRVMPGARAARVPGGHLIDPADPVVLSFVAEVCGTASPAA